MGRGDAVNLHEVLTGSTPEGRATVCSDGLSGARWDGLFAGWAANGRRR